jgi:small-conductance mechanosensitive channel
MTNFNLPVIDQNFLLRILGGFLLLIAGLIIAKILEKVIRKFLEKIRLNQLMKRLGWVEAFSRVGINLDMVRFFGEVAKWLIIIIFLFFATEFWGLDLFSHFLSKIVDYFPDILIASLIFLATVYLVDFTYRIFFGIVKEEKEKIEVSYSKFLGVAIRRTIWVLATLAILYQLKIVPELILSIFIAILAILVLVIGISFGLGGKDFAKKILDEWKEKLP